METTDRLSQIEARLASSEKKRRTQTLILVFIPMIVGVALVWYSHQTVETSAAETKSVQSELTVKTQEVQELETFKNTVEEAVSALPETLKPPTGEAQLTPKEAASHILNGFHHTVDSLKQTTTSLKQQRDDAIQQRTLAIQKSDKFESDLRLSKTQIAERDQRLEAMNQHNEALKNNLERTRSELTAIRNSIQAQNLQPAIKSQLLNRVNSALQNAQTPALRPVIVPRNQ